MTTKYSLWHHVLAHETRDSLERLLKNWPAPRFAIRGTTEKPWQGHFGSTQPRQLFWLVGSVLVGGGVLSLSLKIIIQNPVASLLHVHEIPTNLSNTHNNKKNIPTIIHNGTSSFREGLQAQHWSYHPSPRFGYVSSAFPTIEREELDVQFAYIILTPNRNVAITSRRS